METLLLLGILLLWGFYIKHQNTLHIRKMREEYLNQESARRALHFARKFKAPHLFECFQAAEYIILKHRTKGTRS